ncbi:MAG TPA: helix-turn-helix domain-containing protein, partial [Propionibacteriaceae bacterium]
MDDRSSTYLSVAETAKQLGVHRNTVLSWVRQGILTSGRLPGARAHRFHQRDVERLLRQRGAPVSSVSHDRITVGPELVTGSQLSQWAKVDSRDAQQTLPELFRRLLLATDGVTVKSMASGDGVSNEGWDGLVDVRSSRFLPAGPIGIEMGTDRRTRAKAQGDYDKRTNDPLGLDPAGATFVFVTPHRWKQGATWVAERLKDEVWRDVMVVDADVLEAWLHATPSVHIWISEHLGRRPRHAETLGTWWERYRTKTNPPLPLALFAAGRGAVATRLTEFLASPPDILVLQSTWTEDVLAFVYATLAGPDGQSEHASEPVIVVDDAGVWDDIVAQPGRVVLIPTHAGADVAAAQAAGHHVVLPAGRDQVLSGTVVELPKPSRDAAARAFEDVEIGLDEAYRLAGLARRSLPSLVRTRARDP